MTSICCFPVIHCIIGVHVNTHRHTPLALIEILTICKNTARLFHFFVFFFFELSADLRAVGFQSALKRFTKYAQLI